MQDLNRELTKEALETLALLFDKIEERDPADVQQAINEVVEQLALWSIARRE